MRARGRGLIGRASRDTPGCGLAGELRAAARRGVARKRRACTLVVRRGPRPAFGGRGDWRSRGRGIAGRRSCQRGRTKTCTELNTEGTLTRGGQHSPIGESHVTGTKVPSISIPPVRVRERRAAAPHFTRDYFDSKPPPCPGVACSGLPGRGTRELKGDTGPGRAEVVPAGA